MASARKNLSDRQAKFVAEYLVDANGTRAAVAAGYGGAGAHVAASRLLIISLDKVQKALQARQTADATRLSLRRNDVIAGLLEAVERARAMGNPAAMISGLSALAKLLGFFSTERRQIEVLATGSATAEIGRLEAMSDAELVTVITGRRN